MSELTTKIQLPGGEIKTVALPDDVPLRELLPEVVTALNVPVTGPDGRPVSYRIDSKALGRSVREEETLAGSGVQADDLLILSPVIVAGAVPSAWYSNAPAIGRCGLPIILELLDSSDERP